MRRLSTRWSRSTARDRVDLVSDDYLKAHESDHEVLTSVQELTNGVEVAGVHRGLDQDVHQVGR